MKSKTNALKRKGACRPGSRSTRSGIRWDLYQDGHHVAYVRGREGAYELTALEHPAFMDGKGWAVFVERARDNTSGSMDSERIAEEKGSGSSMGSDPSTFVMKKAEGLFLDHDQFVGNITAQEYRRWNELHPGRDGYRTSDWVIYARKRGSKSIFMPFTPYGHTTRKDDTIHAMRVGPEYESSVRKFLEEQSGNPDWEFEARSGPEGPNERRIRAETKPVSKSTRSGSNTERLAWDIVDLAYDFDPYEFRDQYGSREEFFAENMALLSTKKGIGEVIDFFDGEPIDFDSRLEARRQNVLKRLRKLSTTQNRSSKSTRMSATSSR